MRSQYTVIKRKVRLNNEITLIHTFLERLGKRLDVFCLFFHWKYFDEVTGLTQHNAPSVVLFLLFSFLYPSSYSTPVCFNWLPCITHTHMCREGFFLSHCILYYECVFLLKVKTNTQADSEDHTPWQSYDSCASIREVAHRASTIIGRNEI